MRNTTSRRAKASLLLTGSVLALVVAPALADARPGIRGGASSSISRGGGGGMRGGGGGFGGGSFGGASARQGGGFDRGGGGAAARQRPSASQRPTTGGGNRVNNGGDRIQGGNRIQGGGNRINTGDVNINRNVNVSDNRYDGWGDNYRPIGGAIIAGAVIGSAVTAAAVRGSYYYSLPSGCSPYPYLSYTYYSCGGVYYETRYEADKVVYVVVDKPG